MTFYCFTSDCLRDYILRYFGEYGSSYCGNCSNCLTQFEEVDVTETARALIRCVESSRQRYGTTVIVDTLRGAKTAKIKSYRMDEDPCYGACAKTPVYKIRRVLDHLQLKGYLQVTDDGYAIVKLTESSREVLEEGSQVIMKAAKETERPEKGEGEKKKESKGKKGPVGGVELTEKEETLFQKLRALRTQIAREESVPPYIVFSDKTLVHMCMLKPRTRQEMLSVSGVGDHKYEKYGERFLGCIAGDLAEAPDRAIDQRDRPE